MALTHQANAGIACTTAVLSIVLNNGGTIAHGRGALESANTTRHLIKSGIRKLLAGKFEEAILSYSLAIQISPGLAEAYYRRGVAHFYLRANLAAIADFTQAIQLQPALANAYNYRGLTFYQQQQMREAIVDLTQALKCDPHLAEAYYYRELVYQELWHGTEVYSSSGQLLTVAVMQGVAGQSLESRWHPETLVKQPAATGSHRTRADSHYERGLVMLRRGDRPAAIEKLQAAADLYRQEQQAQYQRTEKLLNMLELASRQMQRAVS